MSERIGQSIEEKDSLEFYSDEQVNICKKEEVQEENQLYHICSKCHMRFPLESMLKRHKAVHHLRVFVLKTKRIKQKYERRSKSTVRKSTKKIRKEAQKQEYSCTQCNFNSRSQAALRVHLKRKHKKKLKTTNELDFRRSKRLESAARSNFTEQSCLVCDSCDFQCETVDVLTAHTSQCRGKIDLKVENCSSKLEKSNRRSLEPSNSRNESFRVEETTGTTLFCSGCTFRCKKRSTMSSHVARKHNDKERNSGNSEECCDLCDFKCSKKSTLYSHKRRHKAETLAEVYSCNECDFKTVKKTSLYSHIKRKHKVPNSCTGDEQPELFYCNQCDYKNKNKYELKVHVARKHTDDFKFSCETCGKKFKVKGDLTNHIRFSHREQPVICDVCGKTCLNSNSLYVHQKFAHYKAKYECQVCKRRMVSQENLNEHMIRQHERKENVVCEECGKTFSRNSRLKVHMRIHTGDKPYTCTICSKAFARRTALKQHLLIHTGIRPYVCDICGKAFTQKPGLISHRKSHPGSHPPLPRVLIDHILNDVMNN